MSEYPSIDLPVRAVYPRRFDWSVLWEESGSDRIFTFKAANLPVSGQKIRRFTAESVKKVCGEFLRIQTVDEGREFFRRYGPLHVEGLESRPGVFEFLEPSGMAILEIPDTRRFGGNTKSALGHRALPRGESVRWTELLREKGLFEAALLGEGVPDEINRFIWGAPLPLQMQLPSWGMNTPFVRALASATLKQWKLRKKEDLLPSAFITCPDVRSAIRVNVVLSAIAESRWIRCKRPKCGKVFEQDAGYRTEYCTTRCASAESSRAAYRKKKLSEAQCDEGAQP
jgi:hypothetical protein